MQPRIRKTLGYRTLHGVLKIVAGILGCIAVVLMFLFCVNVLGSGCIAPQLEFHYHAKTYLQSDGKTAFRKGAVGNEVDANDTSIADAEGDLFDRMVQQQIDAVLFGGIR